jgi:hypothetical protein
MFHELEFPRSHQHFRLSLFFGQLLHHRAHDKSPCSWRPLHFISSNQKIPFASFSQIQYWKIRRRCITKGKYLVIRGSGSADDCDDQEGPEAGEGCDKMIGRWRFVVFLLFSRGEWLRSFGGEG